jgi:probable F420-dependent oxidoreductase
MPPMKAPRMLMILSENWTLTSGRRLADLVRWARTAEDTGFDAVMISEHVVLGPDAGARGVMGNPRDYALPGNQDPLTPWPNSLLLLASIAAVTERVRLVASAVLAPLRHPLLLARELGTLDLLSEGRLVVQPTVSWSRDEYRALGVSFAERGRILDEQLEILALLWRESPASYAGKHFSFDDVYLEPKAHRPDGPRLWFGGQRLHSSLLRRLVRYGHGWHPLGRPGGNDRAVLGAAMADAGRSVTDLEMVGGTRARFPDDHSVADLAEAMAVIPEQLEQGFTTFCVKPSQFIDDPRDLEHLCRDVMRRAEAMSG